MTRIKIKEYYMQKKIIDQKMLNKKCKEYKIEQKVKKKYGVRKGIKLCVVDLTLR